MENIVIKLSRVRGARTRIAVFVAFDVVLRAL